MKRRFFLLTLPVIFFNILSLTVFAQVDVPCSCVSDSVLSEKTGENINSLKKGERCSPGPGLPQPPEIMPAEIIPVFSTREGEVRTGQSDELKRIANRIFDFLDLNSDGKIDRLELARLSERFRNGEHSGPGERGGMDEQFRAGKRPGMFGKGTKHRLMKIFDVNGDGRLDDLERERAIECKRILKKQLLEKFDADRDGKLGKEERMAFIREFRHFRSGDEGNMTDMMIAGRKKWPAGPGTPERAGKRRMARKILREKFDLNRDGIIDEKEREIARERLSMLRKTFLEKFDRDGDGTLSPEEKKEAIALFRTLRKSCSGDGQLFEQFVEKSAVAENPANNPGAPHMRESCRKEFCPGQAHKMPEPERCSEKVQSGKFDENMLGEKKLDEIRQKVYRVIDLNENGIIEPEEKEILRSLSR